MSAEEKVTSSCATSSSTASSKRKERSRSLSDDDSNNNSISDDGGAVRSNVASKTLQIRKKDKVESSKGAKKTPLGNILSSLLRKKEGFTIHQDPGSASPSHEKASGGVAAELSGAKGITTGNSDHHTSIPTHSAEEAAAIPRLVDSTDPATSERKEVASDTVSDPSERRGDAGYTEKKKRKLFRIQRRLRKIVRAQARERTDARATVR